MRLYTLIVLLFSIANVVVASNPFNFPKVILTLSPKDEGIKDIDDISKSIIKDYKKFVTDELKCSVEFEYELINGILINLGNGKKVASKVCDALKLDLLDLADTETLLKGLKVLFYNFRKDLLQKNKIILEVEEDKEVNILNNKPLKEEIHIAS